MPARTAGHSVAQGRKPRPGRWGRGLWAWAPHKGCPWGAQSMGGLLARPRWMPAPTARREDTRTGRPLLRWSVWDPGSRTTRTGLLSAMETRQGALSCSPDPTSFPLGSLQPGEPFPPWVLITESRGQAVRDRLLIPFRKCQQLCLARLQVCDQGLRPQVGWARGHLGGGPTRGQGGWRAKHMLPEPEFGAPRPHSSWTPHGPRESVHCCQGRLGLPLGAPR